MRKIQLLIAVFPMVLLSSCATIISGTKAEITVTSSNASWANLIVDGESYKNMTFPATIKVKRGFKPSVIEAENLDSKGSVTVEKKFNNWAILNLTNIIGWTIDVADGAIMEPEKTSYSIPMRSKNNGKSNKSGNTGNTGNNNSSGNHANGGGGNNENRTDQQSKEDSNKQVQGQGNTAFWEPIIHWDIQSRPQDADIFWRVESNTSDVKSGYNKYIQTTPYEATKALDIKGLTYQTSGNVRIILRCEKDGYLPQEKEFDVRMVLDQEEISAFFRLVKDE